MSQIDQNKTIFSLQSALTPSLNLIDGREEIDRLKFLTEYATLINFYDQENTINGTWNPFLMKDPVFLLANIARVNYTKIHGLYNTTCTNLKQVISNTPTQENISIYFNQLFNQLLEVFMKIERWSYFMDKYHHDYSLKNFVIHKLKLKFSAYFWALIALWKDVSSNQTIKGIQTIDTSLFQEYSKAIWVQSNEPFWNVLNIQMPLNPTEKSDKKGMQECLNKVLNTLVFVGDQLFSFLSDIIDHASTEYDSLSVRKGVFPDTSLLRAFVKLQEIQQEQLNGISKKHLEFYFKDILKQKKRNAEPDKAIISAELVKKDNTFQLAEGTLFKAGVDVNKQPILFRSLNSTNLNPGILTSGFTLAQNKDSNTGLISLYKAPVEKQTILKKNKVGNTIGWKTFGGQPENIASPESLGFAFASPLLYLKEGTRKITIKLSFEAVLKEELFTQAKYYLSTKTGWLELKEKGTTTVKNNSYEILPEGNNKQEISLEIILNPSEKPIEKFTKNPDEIDVYWPMFKMMFDQFDDLSEPPIFSAIDISVAVANVKSFTLNSDYGVLSTKKPYQLFGPTPVLNNSFIIGSEEIFSKPLTFLNIQIDWDGLPTNFQNYYQEYNDNMNLEVSPQESSNSQTTEEVKKGAFNNKSFTSNFDVLQDNEWETLTTTKQSSCSFDNKLGRFVCKNYADQKLQKTVVNANELLFSTTENNTLQSSSVFSFQIGPTLKQDPSHQFNPVESTGNSVFSFQIAPTIKPDPSLQHKPLKFTEKSTNGFLKMNLIGPEMGFGTDVYAKVVSNIAHKNAKELIDKKAPTHAPANLPFVPNVKLLSANYAANQSIQLDFSKSDTPFQCFAYTPNKTYQVYDSSPDADFNPGINKTTLDGIQSVENILPLFPAIESEGVLYLSMDKLVAPCELNLYFELARKTGTVPDKVAINYRYLTASGWKVMPVLSDVTKNFTCSGIIKVSISDDISSTHVSMPNDQFWLSIGVPNNPNSYPDTIYLQSNGFEVERTGTSFLSDMNTPKLPAGAISKSLNPIPEISKVVQIFPSFSGRGAEDGSIMNKRISTRLRTKDRVINSVDYFGIIKQEFPDIFYSKCVYDKVNRKTKIYLVKKFEHINDVGAFIPLVSVCTEEMVAEYLSKRASAFANIETLNFIPEYVSVTANVLVDKNYGLGQIEKEINKKLNLYLSPWIESDAVQMKIDQGLTKSQISSLIKNIEGVLSVSSIEINKSLEASKTSSATDSAVVVKTLIQTLLVTSENHQLKCKHLL
ncbi:MAG: hypothetical protein HRT69_06745 [Flavobacteriaceae bacterium]|nr:hypothetical protein [Flavobacteriaceae bacterium]